jgi:putative endonuclease
MPYYTYIASNPNRTVFYTGMTNNIVRRMYEHQNKLVPGFTSKYNVIDLLWVEEFPTAIEAITAEKKIKGKTRDKKLKIIQDTNPNLKTIPLN